MTRTTLTLTALLCAPTAWAGAPVRQAGNLGLGLGGGLGVSGLSAKYYLSEKSALQGVVGFWGAGQANGGIGVSADYLFEMPMLAKTDVVDIGWNFGLGGSLAVTDPLFVGASGIAGLEFNFNPAPLDLVLEYRPGISILPDVGADLVNFSGHLRYYF